MEKEIKTIKYSVVIPVYNEEKSLDELYRRLVLAMDRLGGSWEVIFVDDGSKDKSLDMIRSLNAKDGRARAVSFSRNFGHHIAITAGLDHARGAAVILMDGDLQDPPEEIIRLDAKLREGYDIVCAIHKTRQDPFLKKLAGKIFYFVFRYIGKVKINSNSGIFRIVSRRALESALKCRENSRFVVGIIDWVGFKTATIEIDRGKRYAGEPKYNFIKSLKLALDAIFSFSVFPLQIASYTGFIIASVSFVYGVVMIIKKLFFGMAVLGYTSIIASIMFIGGIQLLIIGIIGEYIGRIYDEVKGRPMYVVGEKIGLED